MSAAGVGEAQSELGANCRMPPPTYQGAFGLIPASARIPSVWIQPFSVILMTGVCLVLSVAALVAAIVILAMNGVKVDQGTMQQWRFGLALTLGFDLLFVLVALFWVKKVERRSLATAGFARGPRPGDLAWFAGGVVWALVMGAALAKGMPQELRDLVIPTGPAASAALASAGGVLGSVIVLAFCEEAVFRGWLMSMLSRRTGPFLALVVSSVVFACLHVPFWQAGDPARALSLASYTAMGMGLGAVAMMRGQIWTSTALHAGFNSLLLLTTFAADHFDKDAVWKVVADAKRGSSNLFEGQMLLLVNGTVAAILVIWWLTSRANAPKPPKPTPVCDLPGAGGPRVAPAHP